jgi:hypothetical protein
VTIASFATFRDERTDSDWIPSISNVYESRKLEIEAAIMRFIKVQNVFLVCHSSIYKVQVHM